MKFRTVSRCLVVAALLGSPVLLGAAGAPAAPSGTQLVDETFTGATADAGFHAVGSACLTGAAPAALEPGTHPLGGCPEGQTGPVPPKNGAPHGYLQLTDASRDQTAAVLYDRPIPSNQGLDVTFEQWQYGNTSAVPADGIAFFLTDGGADLTNPGAFGGSLGYAQKLPDDDPAQPFLPGVAHGYVGVGLDVLGNYFGDWEHRGAGCSRRSPAGTAFHVPAPGANMVTVRGPGDGQTGYCFLDATTSNFSTTGPWPSTLPGPLQGTLTTMPPGVTAQQAETLLMPSRRTVDVHVSPAPDPTLTVTIDFHDGNGPQQVLSTAAPQPVPASYRFGFAASTGLFTDVHLIRNVTVSSVEPLASLDIAKHADPDHQLPAVRPPGTRIDYTYTVTNSGTVDMTDVAVTDSTITSVRCPSTTLPAGQSMTCHGHYSVTKADAQRGQVTNTAHASGTIASGTVTSPTVKATVPLPQAALRLTKTVDHHRVYHTGDTVTYHYRVTNLVPTRLTGLVVDDDRVADVTCTRTALAPAGEPHDSTTCTATYRVTAQDSTRGHVTNTATATASGWTSNRATATITVAPTGAAATSAAASQQPLPQTGGPLAAIVVTGSVLAAAGLILLGATRFRRRV